MVTWTGVPPFCATRQRFCPRLAHSVSSGPWAATWRTKAIVVPSALNAGAKSLTTWPTTGGSSGTMSSTASSGCVTCRVCPVATS